MNTSRKKYRRSLKVNGIIRLVLFGAVVAIVASAFVVVKNRQHRLANERRAMLNEISTFEKEADTIELRIAAMIDRQAIAARLGVVGHSLVKIERTESVLSDQEPETQLASYPTTRRVPQEF